MTEDEFWAPYKRRQTQKALLFNRTNEKIQQDLADDFKAYAEWYVKTAEHRACTRSNKRASI